MVDPAEAAPVRLPTNESSTRPPQIQLYVGQPNSGLLATVELQRDPKSRYEGALGSLLPQWHREVEQMKPTPPESLRLVAPEQFLASGQSQVDVFRRQAGLTPSSSVLDPGCGAGRHALALVDVLDPDSGGKYVGLDVEKKRIDWCRKSITPRWGHMRFFHLDVESPMFNPGGHLHLEDEDFQLPVRDHAFELIILWSLFTHLRPEGVDFYFREISRLLSGQGAAFVTAYLWTSDTAEGFAHGQPRFRFEHDMGVWRAHRIDQPEWAVAYKQDWWEERLAARGLHVDWLRLGNWRQEPTHGQDMMVIRPT